MIERDLLVKDILEQPQAFYSHMQRLLDIPKRIANVLPPVPSVIFTGIATSLSAIHGNLCLMESQGLLNSVMINTSDLLDYRYSQKHDTRPLIIVSRSGESAEILRLLDTISLDRIVVGITETPDSPLGHRANLILDFQARELAFPNTLSFTLSQLYVLGVCCGLGYLPSKPLEALIQELCDSFNTIFCKQDNGIGHMAAQANGILLEGQGTLDGIVSQYALDFHETRTLAIPVSGGTMRHGVMELTTREDIFTILLIPCDQNSKRKFNLAQELWALHHNTAIITNDPACNESYIPTLLLPKCSRELTPLLFTAGMQLIYLSYVNEKGLSTLSPSLIGKVTRKE